MVSIRDLVAPGLLAGIVLKHRQTISYLLGYVDGNRVVKHEQTSLI